MMVWFNFYRDLKKQTEILNPADSFFEIWSVWQYKKMGQEYIFRWQIVCVCRFQWNFRRNASHLLHRLTPGWPHLQRWDCNRPTQCVPAFKLFIWMLIHGARGWEVLRCVRAFLPACQETLWSWRREQVEDYGAPHPGTAGNGKPLQGKRHGRGNTGCVCLCVCAFASVRAHTFGLCVFWTAELAVRFWMEVWGNEQGKREKQNLDTRDAQGKD